MIERPATILEWIQSGDPVSVTGAAGSEFNAECSAAVEEAIKRLGIWAGTKLTGSVTVRACPTIHHGYGSKTAIILSSLTAVASANSLTISRDELCGLSGRGGTSGIGIHGHFLGGLIIDGGHRQDARPFGPSSLGPPADIPPLRHSVRFPEDWQVAIINVPDGRALSGAIERAVFRDRARITPSEVNTAIASVYHGVLPAVANTDIDLLRESLFSLSRHGFKRLEIAAQPKSVSSALHELHSIPGVASGMSSMGPTIFAIHSELDSAARSEIQRISSKRNLTTTWTRAAASGVNDFDIGATE